MWHLEFGKLYYYLFGVKIPSYRNYKVTKAMIAHTTFCATVILMGNLTGCYILLFANQHVCDSPWAILHTINYLTSLVGKSVSLIVAIVDRKAISTLTTMATCLHDHLRIKFPNSKINRRHNLVKSILVVIICIYNLEDLWVDNVPLTRILHHISQRFTNDLFLLGFVVVLLSPSIWIYYAVQFNNSLMILEDLHMHCVISDTSFDANAILRTQRVNAEDIFTISVHPSQSFNDFPISEHETAKRRVTKCKQFSRVYFRTIHFRVLVDQIFCSQIFGNFLCSATDFPLYVLYSLYKTSPSHLSLNNLTQLFFVAEILVIFGPVFINIYANYKKYYFSVKTTRKAVSCSDPRMRKVLGRCLSLTRDQYLLHCQTFCLLDSSVVTLVSDISFLLLTTFVN